MATATQEAMHGVSARRYIGQDVRDVKGSKIGEISDLIVDSQNGCALFAIVDEGGVLGVMERHHAVPWEALNWEPDGRALRASFDQATLVDSPAIDRDEPPMWTDQDWQGSVYKTFGVVRLTGTREGG